MGRGCRAAWRSSGDSGSNAACRLQATTTSREVSRLWTQPGVHARSLAKLPEGTLPCGVKWAAAAPLPFILHACYSRPELKLLYGEQMHREGRPDHICSRRQQLAGAAVRYAGSRRAAAVRPVRLCSTPCQSWGSLAGTTWQRGAGYEGIQVGWAAPVQDEVIGSPKDGDSCMQLCAEGATGGLQAMQCSACQSG